MTKIELFEILQKFIVNKDKLIAEIYFILKNNEETYLKFADIDEVAQIELTLQFVQKVKEEILDNDDISVISISNADERKNVIYEYDLDEIPEELKHMDYLVKEEEIEYFKFKEDKLENIKGFLILINYDGDNLILYKKHYPFSLLKKDTSISLRRSSNNRFIKLEEDIIKISPDFQFFQIRDTLFINELKTLERFFGFHEIIKKKAKNSLEKIKDINILDNPEVLEPMIQDVSFARKLTKVATMSPVLDVPAKTIIDFTDIHPALKGKFKYNDSKSKLILDTKISKKLFVKLLNDDYLQSQLTKLYYDSLAKDAVNN